MEKTAVAQNNLLATTARHYNILLAIAVLPLPFTYIPELVPCLPTNLAVGGSSSGIPLVVKAQIHPLILCRRMVIQC